MRAFFFVFFFYTLFLEKQGYKDTMKHTYKEQKVGHLYIYTDGTLMEINVNSHSNRSVMILWGHKHNPFFPILQKCIKL